jgi:hypothetical protein
MRKLLLAATILASFAAAPAFAGSGADGGMISGNVALATSGSNAGVSSVQGTMANAKLAGNGGVIVGAVSGNYTAVDTMSAAKAGQGHAKTETTAQQTNIGGTVAGGLVSNKDGRQARGGGDASLSMHGNSGVSGAAGGSQTSTATGGSVADAANLGGFIKVEQPKQGGGHRGR